MGPDYINNGGELKLELVFNEKVTLTDNDFKLDEELGATINIDKLETNNGGLNWTVTLSVADETYKDTEYTLGLTEKFLKNYQKKDLVRLHLILKHCYQQLHYQFINLILLMCM